MSNTTQSPSLGVVLRGVPRIAQALGETQRSTYHLLETGALAGAGFKKVGGRWCGMLHKLREFLEAKPSSSEAA